jgi:hypothetical protein
MVTYPNILEKTPLTLLIALSDTEVGKVKLPSPFVWVDVATQKPLELELPTLQEEAMLLKYANRVNDLMPKYIRLDTWKTEDGQIREMLVMERLYPLPIHHFDLPTRIEMMQQFEIQLKALHDNLFVHGDLMRPTRYYNRNDRAWIFQNMMQTQNGIRLIDAGFSMRYSKAQREKFVAIWVREEKEIVCFKDYYLQTEEVKP